MESKAKEKSPFSHGEQRTLPFFKGLVELVGYKIETDLLQLLKLHMTDTQINRIILVQKGKFI